MPQTSEQNSWSRISVVIAAVIAIAAAVAAHFNGVNEARSYTDQKVDKLEIKIDRTFDRISEMQSDISSIKTDLEVRK